MKISFWLGRYGIALFHGHHCEELLVVDLAVTVNVNIMNDLIDFVIVKLLAKIAQHMAQFMSRDETITVLNDI